MKAESLNSNKDTIQNFYTIR